jgi:iron complex outermembrane receptor protein
VNPEKVTTYELGAKTDLFGDRLHSNFALFYNDFSDYQAVVNNPIVNGVPLNVSVIVNAGKARTYGAEFENTARVTRDLDWHVAITALRTEFLEFDNPTGAASTNYKGNQLNRSPHLTVGTGFSYHLPLSIPGAVRWDGDLAYATSSYDDIGNTIRIPPNSTINTGLFYTTASQHWTFSALVRNVADRTFIIGRTNTPSVGADIVTYDQPRTFLVGARFDF